MMTWFRMLWGLIDVPFFLHVLYGLFLTLIHALQLLLHDFHELSLLVLDFLSSAVLVDALFDSIDESI